MTEASKQDDQKPTKALRARLLSLLYRADHSNGKDESLFSLFVGDAAVA